MMLTKRALAALSLLGLASAQVTTKCNPTEDDNCPIDPAFGTDHTWDFSTAPSYDLWETTAGNVQFDANNYAQFTINRQGDSPTIRTRFYFFFGRTELWLKVAPGVGIVSSTMWLSDDLDEVDWEFLGVNNTYATTNYFGKGRQDYNNGGFHFMPNGMQDDYHNYTTHWTKDKIDWYIDGSLVRTLDAQSANNTNNFPQTPMRLSIGIWAGGDPSLPIGTRTWAGGDTDYSKGPFTMSVKSAQISDFTSGKEYRWGDKTGSWQSIQVTGGNSTALDALNKPPAKPKKSLAQKWAELPSTTKTGVFAGIGGALGLGLAIAILYCCRQRRLGAKEARIAAERERNDRLEVEKFKRVGTDSDSFSYHDDKSGSIRNNSMLNGSTYQEPEASGPLDKEGWNAAHDAPATAPKSPALPGPGGFDFGVPPSHKLE